MTFLKNAKGDISKNLTQIRDFKLTKTIFIDIMDEKFMPKVWSEFKQKGAEGLTLTDCLSRKIRYVFAFDRHLKTSDSVLLKG